MIDKVDAISIVVPTVQHYNVAKYFANSKVNLLIEKPLAQNSEFANKIVRLCEKNQVTLSVGHIERHNEVIKYAAKKLKSGEWGDLISLSAKKIFSIS